MDTINGRARRPRDCGRAGEPRPSLRFLVVDDDVDIRSAWTHIVEHLGHHADQACDGAEAVEAVAGQTYDFILLDLAMPRMSGMNFLGWLQNHPEWSRGSRVIVVSGGVGREAAGLIDIGAHTVLAKPLRVQDLRDLIGETSSPMPLPRAE